MNNFYATAETVGEWDGQEERAAAQFNVIVSEIIRLAGDGAETENAAPAARDEIENAVHAAWDEMGSDEALLTMTADELRAVAQRLV